MEISVHQRDRRENGKLDLLRLFPRSSFDLLSDRSKEIFEIFHLMDPKENPNFHFYLDRCSYFFFKEFDFSAKIFCSQVFPRKCFYLK